MIKASDCERRTDVVRICVDQRSEMMSDSCAFNVAFDAAERLIRSMSGNRLMYIEVAVSGLYEPEKPVNPDPFGIGRKA